MNERILVVKLADLGDVLLCEPAIRSLRDAYADATIDLLVPQPAVELASLFGHRLRTIVFDKTQFDSVRALLRPHATASAMKLAVTLRRNRYTHVVLLHHLTTQAGAVKFRALERATRAPIVAGLDNGRDRFLTHKALDLGFGAKHEAEYMLSVARAAGGSSVDSKPRLNVTSIDSSLTLGTPYVAMHPVTGGYAPARTWHLDRWIEVATRLRDDGFRTVVVGARDAHDAAQAILGSVPDAVDMTGKTTIAELAGLLTRASCFAGGDSFVGHLAAAIDCPTVSVFGPSNVEAWRPWGEYPSHHVVLHSLPCQPCLYTGFSLGRPHGCPARTCLKLVTTDDVMESIRVARREAT